MNTFIVRMSVEAMLRSDSESDSGRGGEGGREEERREDILCVVLRRECVGWRTEKYPPR